MFAPEKFTIKDKVVVLWLITKNFYFMYRFIGIILMVLGTVVILLLGSLVLIWFEIIQIPKIVALTKVKFNIVNPEFIPTES